jgi:hypothetical protein
MYTVRVMGDPYVHGPYAQSTEAIRVALALGWACRKGTLLYFNGKLLQRYGVKLCVRAVMLGEAR